ncbi:diguanylate cyclase [Methylobacillus flagellatus]|uniref:Diguanylate cyclase (GGDEF domain) n=1 Tax=Methylobacillus flagellatus (strain ATCC 51484 / DSM 6875 / VKM B-1610 / KT) TaxID=265072 RepID=Q1H3Y8_METFK|nr:diguanylate cyclase [Methylobacillus flagellatus]ABE48799.1 diguanylate cyclase (GGDEF domain) [Methylobacillus flagellatus KT]
MRRLVILILLLVCHASAWVQTAALRLDDSLDVASAGPFLQYLEDPGHQLRLQDLPALQSGAWQPALNERGNVNLGYSRSAYWFALPVSVVSNDVEDRLLEIAFASLDHVEVYSPDSRGVYQQQVAGDIYAFDQRPYPHRNLVFPLQLPPGEHVLYIKVVSQGTLTVPVNLWQVEAMHIHDQSAYSLLSLYYGALLALFFYNFLIYLSTRETVFLFYVAFVGSMVVAQASLNGLGNQFLWPSWPEWGNVALPCGMAATGFFGVLFSRIFLNTRGNFPRLDRVMLAFAVLFALIMLSPLALAYQHYALLVSLSGISFSLFVTWVAVVSYMRRNPGAFYFLLAWGAVLAGVVILGLRNLGWVPTNVFTIYSMQIGSAIEMLMLSFALADRITVMRKEKEQAQRDTLNAKQALVDALIKTEQELEERVALRTKEIEAVNTQLRHKERELRYMALHDALTGLANRTLMNDSLKRALARAARDKGIVAVLLIDLDGFKGINDTYGHAAGDLVLQVVAARLRKVTRVSDVTARLGGDEFVVVLEDIHGVDDAVRIAEKLIRELERPVEGGLQISASIGIALSVEGQLAEDALLRQADKAMYEAKLAGRNRWHVSAEIFMTA